MECINDNKKIEFEQTKSSHLTCIIDGKYLHSRYNPIDEAKDLIDTYEEKLIKKSNVLVLGLGLGYHIKEIESILKQNHKDYIIKIVEPNKTIYNKWKETHNITQKRDIEIFLGDDFNNFYINRKNIDFLCSNPLIIRHNPSFKIYEEYFASFLSYTAPDNLENYSTFIDDIALKKYLEANKNDYSFLELNKNIKKKVLTNNNELSEFDYLTLALQQITSNI